MNRDQIQEQFNKTMEAVAEKLNATWTPDKYTGGDLTTQAEIPIIIHCFYYVCRPTEILATLRLSKDINNRDYCIFNKPSDIKFTLSKGPDKIAKDIERRCIKAWSVYNVEARNSLEQHNKRIVDQQTFKQKLLSEIPQARESTISSNCVYINGLGTCIINNGCVYPPKEIPLGGDKGIELLKAILEYLHSIS